MAGLIGMLISPDVSDTSAVTTNCWSCPVEAYDTGLTWNTPATVKMSPFLSEVAPEAHPSTTSVEPVCPAPFTSGVEAVNVPVVCLATFWSSYHESTPSARPANWPSRYCSEICAVGLNRARLAFASVTIDTGSSTATRPPAGTDELVSLAPAWR